MAQARDGVLDLSAWDFQADGPVALSGHWEVRWEELLTPGDLAGADGPPTRFVDVPAPWTRARPDAGWFSAEGAATMRLRVLLPPAAAPLAMRVQGVNAAYALWANGVLVGQGGRPALSAKDERPAMSVDWPELPASVAAGGGRGLELVLQVSNHSLRDGGASSPLLLGSAESMRMLARREAAMAMFLAGTLFIMGVYHVALHLFRRSDGSPLLFAAYCLLWLVNYVCTDSSGWVARSVAPGLPVLGLERFALSAFCLSVPVGYAFFLSLFPREFSRRAGAVCWAVALACCALAALGPFSLLSRALPLYYLFTMGIILHSFERLHRAWSRRREGAGFTLGGFVALGLVGFNDMLADMRVLNTPMLLAPGMLFFILSQAFALSQRLSSAFSAVERLSIQLEQRNERMEQEMAERRRLERQIVNLSEDERRRMSIDLHDGLCQQLTAARLLSAAMSARGGPDLGRTEFHKLSGLLDEMVDQAYDLSHGLWPLEHGAGGRGPSLAEMIHRFSRSSGVPIHFTQRRACQNCSSGSSLQMFRIAQEAISNALKHAKPGAVWVDFSCREGGDITLTVRDDGMGQASAAPSPGGLGMSIMAHRASMIGGQLTVRDSQGGGTEVRCSAPCEASPQRQPAKEHGQA